MKEGYNKLILMPPQEQPKGMVFKLTYLTFTADYFPMCKRGDPEIEKCALEAIENMRERLKEGIPEVNIPAIDPFTVPTLKLDRTAQNLRIKATVKNAKAYGGSDFKIEKLRYCISFFFHNIYVNDIQFK